MRRETLEKIEFKVYSLIPEALRKLAVLKIDTEKDRVRVIFEFEFKKNKIHDAVEIRWRRPWE